MAEIIPSDLTRLALPGGHTPELATLALLRNTLPRDYVVFHGVHWTREYSAWTHFGEIDFVVVNRAGDVLFIEQKNGTIGEGAGGLTKHYGDGSRDVVQQIHRCRHNYRSPDSIARFILRTLPVAFEPANPLPGLGVDVEADDDPAEQPAVVARLLKRLIGMGFAYADIAILTCRGVQNSVFSTLDAIAGVRLRHFTGEYANEAQVMTEGELLFDSVNRYKGQEIPAVILVDVDPRAERLAQELRVLFCGMTRATVRLDLVVRAGNAENGRFLTKET